MAVAQLHTMPLKMELDAMYMNFESDDGCYVNDNCSVQLMLLSIDNSLCMVLLSKVVCHRPEML